MSLMHHKGAKMVKLTYDQNAVISKRIFYIYSSLMFHCLGQLPKLSNELYFVLVTVVLLAIAIMETTDFCLNLYI